MASYCDIAPGHPLHGPYHDTEYGFPAREDRVIFERMALEIMQAGLSWETVLKKRAAFNQAFCGFDLEKVAAFGAEDVARLMQDSGIIRNRRKIDALIENARRILALSAEEKDAPRGQALAAWLARQGPLSREAWVKKMKATFVFMGPEIVGEFLMSLGLLPGAHQSGCPVLKRIGEAQRRDQRACAAAKVARKASSSKANLARSSKDGFFGDRSDKRSCAKA